MPHPTPAWVATAGKQWPDVTLASLERDRGVFVAKCSGCHALATPKALARRRWPILVRDMAAKAKLDDETETAIERYLTAATVAPDGP